MTYETFRALLEAAPSYDTADAMLIARGGMLEDAYMLPAIWRMGQQEELTFRAVAAALGISGRQLALALDIPIKTTESWASGHRTSRWQIMQLAYAALHLERVRPDA